MPRHASRPPAPRSASARAHVAAWLGAAVAAGLLGRAPAPVHPPALVAPVPTPLGPDFGFLPDGDRVGRGLPWIPLASWLDQRRRPHTSVTRIDGRVVGAVADVRIRRTLQSGAGWPGGLRLVESATVGHFLLLSPGEAESPGRVRLPPVELGAAGRSIETTFTLRGLVDGLAPGERRLELDLGSLPVGRVELDVTLVGPADRKGILTPAGARASPTVGGVRIEGRWERIPPGSRLLLRWREDLPPGGRRRAAGAVDLVERWDHGYGRAPGVLFTLLPPDGADSPPTGPPSAPSPMPPSPVRGAPIPPLGFSLESWWDEWSALPAGALSDDLPPLPLEPPAWLHAGGLRSQCFRSQATLEAALTPSLADGCAGAGCALATDRPDFEVVAAPPRPAAPGVRVAAYRRLRRAVPARPQDWIPAAALVPHFAQTGALTTLPACPGFGVAGVGHLVVLYGGEVVCLVHGHHALDRSRARRAGPDASPRQQLAAFGVRDDGLLGVAAGH